MKRHQQILAAVLALQLILGVVVFWPRQAESSTGELLFPNLTAGDIVSLTVVDNAGQQIALKKVDDAWVLPDAGNYPANESAITPVLEKIAKLNTATLVARTEASYEPLQVSSDNFQRKLVFDTAKGESYTIYLGSAPRYTATNFRVEGQKETYLTSELSSWELNATATSWIDTAYTNIDAATVTQVVLENAQGTFTLVKNGDNWTLADLKSDETISAGKTSAILTHATQLSMARPLGTTEEDSYGMASPNAVVTVQTDDGNSHVLTVGAFNEAENGYVVKSSDSQYYVLVAEFNLSAMVGNGRQDFLSVPATPTPASGESAPTTP